jgi:hypothetical protein
MSQVLKRPAINARSRRAGFMVGLRGSFWPMIVKVLAAFGAPLEDP